MLAGSSVPNFDGRLLVRGVNDRTYLYAIFASEGGTTALGRSADAGQTWTTQVLTNLPGPGDLVVDPRDARRLIFVSFAGFCFSMDAGVTWTARNAGRPRAGTFYELSTAAGDRATGTWYVGSAASRQPRGVFRLAASQSWTAVIPAPDRLPITRLAFVPAVSGPVLLAVTSTGALYRLALAGTGSPPGMPRSGAGATATGLCLALLGAALVRAGLRLRRNTPVTG